MKQSFDYEKNPMGIGDSKKRSRGFSRFEYRIYNFLKHIGSPAGNSPVENSHGCSLLCDVGCGGGQFLEKIKKLYPNIRCHGCDISKKAIETAKKLSPKDIDYKLIEKNGKPPYSDGFFDIATSFNVLEHVENIDSNIKEINRILKKGGTFHLCIPTEGQPLSMTWFYKTTKMGKDFTYKNWGHLHPNLTQKDVLKILKANGFEIKKKSYSLHLPIDFINLFVYFLPKELMNILLGKNAYELMDAGFYQNQMEGKEKKGALFDLRKLWLALLQANELLRTVDAVVLQKIPITASTIHITCIKK